jgi:hypothetical protein
MTHKNCLQEVLYLVKVIFIAAWVCIICTLMNSFKKINESVTGNPKQKLVEKLHGTSLLLLQCGHLNHEHFDVFFDIN